MAHITSVRLRGFKSVTSWLDVRFVEGLNAVVGKNGCGKSSLLDALCFAFAAPLRSFAVASLADLASTDSSEVCEVCVQLQCGSGTTRETHTVQAVLTPDGGRAYKVNGRARNGKEVRDWLRGLGICLDSAAAVIKQARVTALADSASPVDLAAVVADASGLGRWNEEVAAATEELKRTRKALREVQGSLLTMEEAVAADGEKLRALERLHQLDDEVASLAQQMASTLWSAVQLCRSQTAAEEASNEALAGRVAEARQNVQGLQAELQEARRQLADLVERRQGGESGRSAVGGTGDGGRMLQLQQAVATSEEEVRLLTEQQQRRDQLEKQVEQAAKEVQQLGGARDKAADELAACQHAQRKVAVDLQQARSAESLVVLRASLATEVRQLAAAVPSKEREAAETASAVAEAAGRLADLQAEQGRLAAAAAEAAAACGAVGNQAWQPGIAAVQDKLRQEQARMLLLQQQEQQLALEAGTLAVRLRSSTAPRGSSTAGTASAATSPACRPLHQCFTVKDPRYCQQYATALQVLAGAKLGVVVADSVEAAGKLLAAQGSVGTGVRIWPLDSLVAADHTQKHRKAAGAFPTGQVLLPLDLLHFDAAYRPAMLRTFATHVIAATSAVAEQLITRFGIPSITPDGSVTSRGTLQGGWLGAKGSTGSTPMQLKLGLDEAEQKLAAVRHEMAAVQAEVDASQRQLLGVQQRQEAAEVAASEVAAATEEVRAWRAQLETQEAAHADAATALAKLQAELAVKRQLLQSMEAAKNEDGSNPGGSSGSKGVVAALRKEEHRLAAAVAELEGTAAAVGAELAAALARLAAAEDEQALCQQDSSWAGQLDSWRAQLADATSALLAEQRAQAQRAAAAAAQEERMEALTSQLSAAERELAAAEEAAAAGRAAMGHWAADQAEMQRQLDGLLKEVPELAGLLPEAGLGKPAFGGGNTCGGKPTDGNSTSGFVHGEHTVLQLRQAYAQLDWRRRKLLNERQRSSAAGLPLSEQLRYREQQAQLAAARQQAATLETAAKRLQEGISGTNTQVLAVNEAVFNSISGTFQSLIAAVLPAYRVRLRKVGLEVHDGLLLEFAHRGGTSLGGSLGPDPTGPEQDGAGAGGEEEAPSGSDQWRTGLDGLSGGQRTLVSLAFVVAAAMSGAGTSLLLMDEVDAALDETNQALVARLFATLSSRSGKAAAAHCACRQVLCISHNAAFQQLCQHVVRLTKGPSGGTQLAEGKDEGHLHDAGGTPAPQAGPWRQRESRKRGASEQSRP